MKLFPPGSVGGPCLTPCRHEECLWKRALARKVCNLCSKPIGFDREFRIDKTADDIQHINCPT